MNIFISMISWAPDRASTTAANVDALFLTLLAISAAVTIGIFGSIIFFSIRYRRTSSASRELSHKGTLALELTWTIIPIFLGLWLFTWAAKVYVQMNRIPKDSLEVYVVGKQWMWKLQHAEGAREINELHVPVGKPVKLLMTSQDVIHSFFIPAFRIKRDVLPGRFEATWFDATKAGEFHIFCAEYCGTEHSRMIGRIVALPPQQYAQWAAEHSPLQTAAIGAELFRQLACNSCHSNQHTARGPALAGLYGRQIRLRDGRTMTADDDYLIRSILTPRSDVAAGYDSIMPSYKGRADEEKLVALVAYIKSLKDPNSANELASTSSASTTPGISAERQK